MVEAIAERFPCNSSKQFMIRVILSVEIVGNNMIKERLDNVSLRIGQRTGG